MKRGGFNVGQASSLPPAAKPTEDLSSGSSWRARWAGRMPALLCGSWVASICFRTRIRTMNWFVLVVLLVLENVQTGWVVEDEDENEEEDEWPGSWRVED